MSDYNYPLKLIKKTKVRIQKQLDGNGLDPKKVNLVVTNQGLGIITGETRFTLDGDVKTNAVKGKSVQGEMIEAGQSKSKIDEFLDGFQGKDSFSTMAKDIITKMPLQGFGADKQDMALKGEALTITEQTQCGSCGGQGKTQCGQCGGRGQTVCTFCHGSGFIDCLTCQGRGQMQVGGKMQICATCQGRGHVFCTQCHGQKQVQCQSCQGRGHVVCTSCDGHGVNSLHTTVTPVLKITSDVFIADLDAEPKNYVAKIGVMKMVSAGHLVPKITKKVNDDDVVEERAYYEDTPIDTSKNMISYEVDVPWAVSEMTYGDKSYKIGMIGEKGAIAKSDNFMDDLLHEPLNLVARAGRGEGYIAGLLKDASAVRVSRETLSLLTRMGPKKAMMAMRKQYAIGFSNDGLQGLVKQSFAAMKMMTRLPRYVGLAIGLLISAALSYLWWFNGLREVMAIYSQQIRYGIDGGMGLMMMVVTMALIKMVGYIPYKKVMSHIGIQTNKMPAMGTAGIYAILGNIAIWAGAYLYLLLG